MSTLAARRSMFALFSIGLFFVGCAHPTYQPYGSGYGYGPTYGPSYAPSYPATPQYMGPSGGTYVPQSITPSNSGSPTPLSTPSTNNNNPLNLRTNPSSPSNSDAPMFNPNPNSGNRPVPPGRDPLDDLNNAAPGASLPATGPTTAQLPPFERGGLAASAPPVVADIVQTSAGSEPDPFEPPSRLPTDLDANPMGAPAAENTPYQYDGQTYKWLKGTVDYDALTRTWSIIYNLTPDVGDKYGGSFVLSAHPDLESFQTGDVALVEGVIDARSKDPTGRPIYTVTKVTGPLR